MENFLIDFLLMSAVGIIAAFCAALFVVVL